MIVSFITISNKNIRKEYDNPIDQMINIEPRSLICKPSIANVVFVVNA